MSSTSRYSPQNAPYQWLIAALCAGVAGGGGLGTWFGGVPGKRLDTIEAKQTEVLDAVRGMDRRLERLEVQSGDRWRKQDMTIWAQQLKIDNAELNVPEVN